MGNEPDRDQDTLVANTLEKDDRLVEHLLMRDHCTYSDHTIMKVIAMYVFKDITITVSYCTHSKTTRLYMTSTQE